MATKTGRKTENAPIEVSLTEADGKLGELSARVAFGGERFVITKMGKRVAALVPLSEVGEEDAA